MKNFEFANPVKLIFGKGQIAKAGEEIPKGAKILLTYGGGSIKENGVYDQVKSALKGRPVLEFGGIEANPRFETLMRAVEIVRSESIDFLLSAGGGSVLDGTKFIAAAAPFKGDAWDILAKRPALSAAVPIGCVLTLPATGSEMNAGAVISREATKEKLFFVDPYVYPRFSILDPEVTYSLPKRQLGNGIVDAFTHVMEQYLTARGDAPLQDRMAEAILLTLIEIGPRVMTGQPDYEARANLMWCCTMALNGLIGLGVPQDWATHMIGHEITAAYGLDHGQTLAVVLPGVMSLKRSAKKQKLLQYAERVWRMTSGSEDERISSAIAATERFFESAGVGTKLSAYGLDASVPRQIAQRFEKRGGCALGEKQDIGPRNVEEILSLRV